MKLNLISWNINMFSPDKPENKNKIISEINNQVKNEDLIFLFESSFEFVSELLKTKISSNYLLFNNVTLSHGGLIHLLYNKKIKDKIEVLKTAELPFVIIKYTHEKKSIFLGGCHLAPFPENGEVRLNQLLLIRSIIPINENIVLIGDMNIREKETKFMEKENNVLNLRDSGDKRKTWYRAFFEPDKVNITSRFDRLFLSPNVKLNKFDLFGKKYENKKLELLSDHLAIKAEVEIC